MEVQDSGIGIPEKAIGRMFQSFSQADSSTSRKYGGSGLGLSISKKLVELMGGTIGVKSTEGQGSTFWFTAKFKLGQGPVESELDPAAIADEAIVEKKTKSKRILIAEDNVVNQQITLRILEKLGYRADVVANGNEVLEALREIPYDLVLMDCQMPEMDGYEATQIIRTSDTINRKNILILAMTANAMKEDKERCLSVGMDGYVSKPVTSNKLASIIKTWLEPSESKTAA